MIQFFIEKPRHLSLRKNRIWNRFEPTKGKRVFPSFLNINIKNMKLLKPFLLSLLFTLGWAYSSQAYEVTIDGTVTAYDAPAPYVDLFIFSVDGSVFEIGFTDANGQYSSTFEIPDGTTTDILVSVIDICTGIFLDQTVTVSGATTETIDFELCSDCQAGFFYYQPDPALLDVQFEDISSGSPDSWTWDFGDGNTSTDQNPLHTYATEGDYTVTLTTTSGDTCSSMISQYVWVYIDTFQTADCQANFFFEYSPDDPLQLNFIDFSWPIDEIASWAWDFGDGNTSTDQNPVHTYAAAGFYNVTLTITTDDGCTSTLTYLIEAGSDPWGYDCWAEYTYEIDSNDSLTVNFTDTSTGDIIDWYWDFGDGNTSADQNPSHTYAEAGTYIVALTILTEDGCSNYYCIFVTVGDGGIGWDECFASFYAYPEFNDPLTMNFEDLSFGFSGIVVTWDWDFGDGNTSTDQFPQHTYADSGIYVVTLTITTDDGCTSTYSEDVYVDVDPIDPCNCPPVWDPVCVTLADGSVLYFENSCWAECFGYYDYESCDPWGYDCYADFWWYEDFANPLTVEFEDFSFPAIPVSWNWDFGDGAVSTAQNPVHTYAAQGEYQVTLTITTADGCTSTVTYPVWVGDIDPPVDPGCLSFFWFTLDPDAPLTVTFEDLTIGDIDTWSWDFGDGNTSTEQNPVHTYAEPGIYPVTLTVSGPDCSSTFLMLVWTDENIIYNEDCQALFIPLLDDLTVQFLDLSVGNNIVDWNWDFGDGNTSTGFWPIHTYDAEGVYDVTLTITTADGCSSEFTIQLDLDDDNFHGISANSAQMVNSTNEIISLENATIFPNPVSEAVKVQFNASSTTDVQLTILNLDGKVMGQQQIESTVGVNEVSFDANTLAAGYYLLRLQSAEGQQTLKFAKQ